MKVFDTLFEKIQEEIDKRVIIEEDEENKEEWYGKLITIDEHISKWIGLGDEGSVLEIAIIKKELDREVLRFREEKTLKEMAETTDKHSVILFMFEESIKVPSSSTKLVDPLHETTEYVKLEKELADRGYQLGLNQNYIETGKITNFNVCRKRES